MSESVQFTDFRASENGATVLNYSSAGDAWICGDSGGSVYTLTRENASTEITASESPITSMAVSPIGDLCAISVDRHLDIHEFPDVEGVKLKMALRTELDITSTVYDKDGAHM